MKEKGGFRDKGPWKWLMGTVSEHMKPCIPDWRVVPCEGGGCAVGCVGHKAGQGGEEPYVKD